MGPTRSLPVLLACVAAAVPCLAQEDDVSPALDDLDQRLRILERLAEIAEESAAEKAQAAPSTNAGKDGFSWKSADGAYVLKMRGYVHSDGRFFSADRIREGTSVLTLRRIRPIVEATLAKSFDVRIMPDWAGGTASLQVGYAEYRAKPALGIRTGKFKPPVGYERLMSATEIVFAERGLPTSLVPNRDVGFQVSGDCSGLLSYAIGLFNGTRDGGSVDTDINDHMETAARVSGFPLKRTMSPRLAGLGLGLAACVGENKGTPASTGLGALRCGGQQTIFSYRSNGRTADSTVVAQGWHLRWSPQGCWYAGRVGGFAEYVSSRQEIRIASAHLEHDMRAWAVTGSVVLTNDEITARGVQPKRPLDPSTGGWGAIPFDARYSALEVDDSAFPTFASRSASVSEARAWAVGATWYVNRNAKILLDWEQTAFEDGATATQGGDRETEKVLFVRTQLSF